MFRMFFMFQKGTPTRSTLLGANALLSNAIICTLFGVSILAAPELLAYFVAGLLLFAGVSFFSMWWKIRNLSKTKVHDIIG